MVQVETLAATLNLWPMHSLGSLNTRQPTEEPRHTQKAERQSGQRMILTVTQRRDVGCRTGSPSAIIVSTIRGQTLHLQLTLLLQVDERLLVLLKDEICNSQQPKGRR